MTLVIAGYIEDTFHSEFDEAINEFKVEFGVEIKEEEEKFRKSSKNFGKHRDGIFVISDSMITTPSYTHRRPLVTGFKKNVEIEIKIKNPSIGNDGYFRDYNQYYIRYECLLSFAGSTLVAQHIINSVSNHLSDLKLDYEYNKESISEPKIRMPCESVNFESNPNDIYDEDFFGFNDSDLNKATSNEIISEIVKHSINRSIKSAQKYRLDSNSILQMKTDFILLLRNPITGEESIYKYTMKNKNGADGIVTVYVDKELIPHNKIAVIGMTNQFEEKAKKIAENAIKNGASLMEEMTEFMKNAILEVEKNGSFEIGFPIAIKKLNNKGLEREIIQSIS
ncbi:hypothetical protein [Thalassospira lucentensis]|uniref:hypothetical protein n=1 Tax=Thalassospira lucentensis TaxID=168935 RepID=UPI00142E009F|nr:hypothetical protein [Thalassospira lucentensis]NIZ01635.1 hypothetical protein [Thalassospira lucentensis]